MPVKRAHSLLKQILAEREDAGLPLVLIGQLVIVIMFGAWWYTRSHWCFFAGFIVVWGASACDERIRRERQQCHSTGVAATASTAEKVKHFFMKFGDIVGMGMALVAVALLVAMFF